MISQEEALREALDVLRVSEGNVRSLGPAGQLGEVYTPYKIWIRVLRDAIAKCEEAIDP